MLFLTGMTLICGCSSFKVNEFNDQVRVIENEFDNQNLIKYSVNQKNFSGNIYVQNRNQYKLTDFYFEDLSNDLLILLSGHIYGIDYPKDLKFPVPKDNPIPVHIAHLFSRYGIDFINWLNGDFIIFIVDQRKQILYIVRDHLGIRPLSFCVDNDSLLFSSDGYILSRAFAEDKGINRKYLMQELTPDNLWDYSLTPVNHVEKLLPGHYLEFGMNGYKQVKYWHPESIQENSKLESLTASHELEKLLIDSVKIRTDKEVKAGAHVSGGLDSGLVAAIARQQYIEQPVFYGYSWSPQKLDGESFEGIDERKNAFSICNHANIDLKYFEGNSLDYFGFLTGWKNQYDHYEESKIRQFASMDGVALIFSGWGGDEFLSFHDLGVDSDLIRNFHFKKLFSRYSLKKPKAFLGSIIYKVILPYLGNAVYLNKYDNKKRFKKYILPGKYIKGKKKDPLLSWKSKNEVQLKYLNNCHLSDRAEQWFINGYKLGIEYRFPLLDKRIIEYCLTIPSTALYKEKRSMLKDIARKYIPLSVIEHNKLADEAWGIYNDKIRFEVFEMLSKRVEDYKKNPFLDFINFPKLAHDLDLFLKNRPQSEFELPGQFNILFGINGIHAITTGLLSSK